MQMVQDRCLVLHLVLGSIDCLQLYYRHRCNVSTYTQPQHGVPPVAEYIGYASRRAYTERAFRIKVLP